MIVDVIHAFLFACQAPPRALIFNPRRDRGVLALPMNHIGRRSKPVELTQILSSHQTLQLIPHASLLWLHIQSIHV